MPSSRQVNPAGAASLLSRIRYRRSSAAQVAAVTRDLTYAQSRADTVVV